MATNFFSLPEDMSVNQVFGVGERIIGTLPRIGKIDVARPEDLTQIFLRHAKRILSLTQEELCSILSDEHGSFAGTTFLYWLSLDEEVQMKVLTKLIDRIVPETLCIQQSRLELESKTVLCLLDGSVTGKDILRQLFENPGFAFRLSHNDPYEMAVREIEEPRQDLLRRQIADACRYYPEQMAQIKSEPCKPCTIL